MITSELNLSMATPTIEQAYAKKGDSGRVLKINLIDAEPEDGTLRIRRPDGVEVTSDAESGVSKSGDVVTFEAYEEVPLEKLEVDLEPVQDTSGGDPSPTNICPIYPSNGKNLCTFSEVSGTQSVSKDLSLSAGTYTVSAIATSDDTDSTQCGILFRYVGGTYASMASITRNSRASVTVTLANDTYQVLFYASISAALSTGDAFTFKDIQIEKGASATPYVPYQGINVYQSGKNLIPRIFSDGKVPSISTGALVNSSNACRSDYISVEGGSVTLSCDNVSNRQIYLFLYDSNMTFLTYQSTSGNFVTVTDANGQYAMVRCDGGTTSPNNIQLELGSSATSYEPYNGTTYPILLGRDVYGGTLDVVSGKLVVDKVFKLVDGSSSTGWNRIATYGTSTRFDFSISDIKYDSGANTLTNMFSKITIGTANAIGFSVHASSHLFQIQVPTATADTVADLMTYFSANNLQIVYVLDTPLEYDLTPTQIKTLIGTNNIWSSGDVKIVLSYGSLFATLPSQATEVVGKCIGDVNFTDISTLPFILTVKENQA